MKDILVVFFIIGVIVSLLSFLVIGSNLILQAISESIRFPGTNIASFVCAAKFTLGALVWAAVIILLQRGLGPGDNNEP
jgi:hypothetical protein